MDDRRGSDTRPGGTSSRSLTYSGPTSTHLKQSNTEPDSPDFAQFRLTRILGEAMYQYGKMRDAEHEKRVAEGEYNKQSQYFDNNVKLREVLESRRTKSERGLSTARSDYARAAREAEPMLRQICAEPPPMTATTVDEETIRRVVQAELRDYVRYRKMDQELTAVERKLQKEFSSDIRSMVSKELKNYTHKSEHERLVDQVKNLNLQGRHTSVLSDTSRDVDQRITAQARDVENIKSELTTRTNQQSHQISLLKDRIDNLQLDPSIQSQRAQTAPGANADDIVKIEAALEKAQEVMNDQYVITHDLQIQVNALLEGVRTLNERIEEYDKRLDGVQKSTETFFTEVQAELERRNNVFGLALDKMHDKFTSEMSAKADTPVAAQHNSPPRIGISTTYQNSASNINPGTTAIITSQMESQAKSINDLRARLGQLHTQVMAHNHNISSVATLPAQVSKFCDDVSSRLVVHQRDGVALSERIKTLELAVTNIGNGLQKQIKTSDGNFRETAIHMESVKTRFGEHRKQLDNLILAWRDAVVNIEQLSGKYEALKEFLSSQLVPTVGKVQKAFPSLFENSGNDPRTTRAQRAGDGAATQKQNQATAPTAQGEGQRRSDGSEGGGGASNPIEI